MSPTIMIRKTQGCARNEEILGNEKNQLYKLKIQSEKKEGQVSIRVRATKDVQRRPKKSFGTLKIET